MSSFWKPLVQTFPSLRTCHKRMDVISFLRNRTSQRQDRPQSDNRGGSEWERLHLDTNHSQLGVDKHLQRRSGMWTGDHEGHQIQGEHTRARDAQQTFLMSEGFYPFFMQLSFNNCLCDLQAPVGMDNGRISIQFPQYHFTAEVSGDKLIMVKEPVNQSNWLPWCTQRPCWWVISVDLTSHKNFSLWILQNCTTPGEKGVTFTRTSRRIWGHETQHVLMD